MVWRVSTTKCTPYTSRITQPGCTLLVVSFQELLASYVVKFGSQTALGRAIHMSPSRINKVLKGRDTFDVANCLRLADATGESPSAILRIAGKADVADLIERMYGKARPPVEPTLTPAQKELLTTWEEIPGDLQGPLGVLIRYAHEISGERDARRRAATGAPPRRRRAATSRSPRAAQSG